MKKIYSKPEIMFEDFTLNESIAGPCEVKTHTPAQGQCGVEFGPFIVFMSTTNCNFIQDNQEYDGFCYHIPSESNNLFNS